jgi:hypothetical protein
MTHERTNQSKLIRLKAFSLQKSPLEGRKHYQSLEEKVFESHNQEQTSATN